MIRRRLQKDEVYERLLAAVLDGTLPAGSRLRDHELEQRLGVSRTPVRMALTRLERLRVVSSSGSRVVRVAEPDPSLVPLFTEMLAALLVVGWRRTLAQGGGSAGLPAVRRVPSDDEAQRTIACWSVLVDGLVTPQGGLLAATTDLAWVPLRHQLRLCGARGRAGAAEQAVERVDAALRRHDEAEGEKVLLELGGRPADPHGPADPTPARERDR
ncbi:GntR family transcriptional regulator [Frigoribacterium salinisoli]